MLCCAIARVLDCLLTCLLVAVVGFANVTVNACNVKQQTYYDGGNNCNVNIKLVHARTAMINVKPVKHRSIIFTDCYYERLLLAFTMAAISNIKPVVIVAITADLFIIILLNGASRARPVPSRQCCSPTEGGSAECLLPRRIHEGAVTMRR